VTALEDDLGPLVTVASVSIEDHILSKYVYELAEQGILASVALDRLNHALSHVDDWEPLVLSRTIFEALNSLLRTFGVMSKLLWVNDDASDRAKRRAQELRSTLGILDDDSPLRDRVVRNNLEHIDERLDTFLDRAMRRPSAEGKKILIADGNIGQIPAYVRDHQILRHFDLATSTYYVAGDRVDIKHIAQAAIDIARVAGEWHLAFDSNDEVRKRRGVRLVGQAVDVDPRLPLRDMH
jgi:hypothetical protein